MLLAREVLLRGLRLLDADAVAAVVVAAVAAPAAASDVLEVDILLTTNLTSFLSSPQACQSFRIREVLASGRSTPRHCSTCCQRCKNFSSSSLTERPNKLKRLFLARLSSLV